MAVQDDTIDTDRASRRLDPAHNVDDYNAIRDALAEYQRTVAAREPAPDPIRIVTITLTFECPADVPAAVIEWMAGNLVQHAEHEFGDDYDPEWTDAKYDKEPLTRVIDVKVA
jgi:hypothetical protein